MSKRKRFKINYSEGDCFLVPLKNGGYARGVVARLNGKGKVCSFFFLPRYEHITDAIIDDYLTPANSLYVSFHSDSGFIVDNRWKVFGKISPWVRDDWHLPVFGFTNTLLDERGELRYYDDKTLEKINEETVSVEKVANLPEDGAAGSGYIEGRLAIIIKDIEFINEIEQKNDPNIAPLAQSGDIIEININDELVYAQYISKPIAKFGHYIRVFEDRHKSRPVVEDILKSKEQFQTFFFLDFELKNNNVKIIANSPIPENIEKFPTLKLYRGSKYTGRSWYIRHTDGSVFYGLYDYARCKNDKYLDTISQEYYNCPLCQIVSYDELVKKIETNWRNDTEVYVGNKFLEMKPQSYKNKTNLSDTTKSKKETSKKKWDINPIKKPLQRILNRLDTIAQCHGEVRTDTAVRDVLHSVVWDGFIDMKKNYSLPDDFAMFSKSGNKKVRTAIEQFLESVRILASEIPALKSKKSRFEAFQDIEIQSKEGSTYDDYFGDSDEC